MLRRFASILVTALILATQVVNVANAAFDEQFYSGNQIYYYDPTCVSNVGQGYITLNGKDNLENILKFFIMKGLTLAQASGIAGNMMAESGLDPTIIQGGGHAQPGTNFHPTSGVGFGLVQWTSGGRQQNLVNFIYGDGTNAGLGVDITDLSGQLSFAWKELSTDYASTLASLKATDDPVQAAIVVHNGYESSADSAAQVASVRGGNAQNFYNMYVDQPAIASAPSDGSASPLGNSSGNKNTTKGQCVSSTQGNGQLSDLVKQYAWPDWAERTDQMPAYTDAVTQAKSEGRYVGGYNGNDCGAFVTLLVRNSGFDQGYNSNGFGGNTTLQEAWLANNWQQLSPEEVANADKQPGDVAINEEHTYIYVGDVGPDFHSKIASASLGDRAPTAGMESATDSSFRWYRIKAPSGGNVNARP